MKVKNLGKHVVKGLVFHIETGILLPFTIFGYIIDKLLKQTSNGLFIFKTGIKSSKSYVKIITVLSTIFILVFTSISILSIGSIVSNGLTANRNKNIIGTRTEDRISNGYGGESYLTSMTVDGYLAMGATLFSVAQSLGDKVLVKTPDFTGQTDVKANWGKEMDSNFIGLYWSSVAGANILIVVFFVINILTEVIKLSTGKKFNFLDPLLQLFIVQLAFLLLPYLTSTMITLFNDMNRIILGDSPLFDYQTKVFEAIKQAYRPKDEGWAGNLLKGGREFVNGLFSGGAEPAVNFGIGNVVGITVLLTQLLTLGFMILIAVTKIQLIFLFVIMPILVAVSLFEITKDIYKNAINTFIRLLCLPLFYIIGFRIVNEFMIKLTTDISLETIILYFAAILFLFSINMITASIFGDWSGYAAEQSASSGNKMVGQAVKTAGTAALAGAGMLVGGLVGAGASGASSATTTSSTAGIGNASNVGNTLATSSGDKSQSTTSSSAGGSSNFGSNNSKNQSGQNGNQSKSGAGVGSNNSNSKSKYEDAIEAEFTPIRLTPEFKQNTKSASQSVKSAMSKINNKDNN